MAQNTSNPLAPSRARPRDSDAASAPCRVPAGVGGRARGRWPPCAGVVRVLRGSGDGGDRGGIRDGWNCWNFGRREAGIAIGRACVVPLETWRGGGRSALALGLRYCATALPVVGASAPIVICSPASALLV